MRCNYPVYGNTTDLISSIAGRIPVQPPRPYRVAFTAFVDYYGNDATGAVEDPTLAFRTIDAAVTAVNAAKTGNTVWRIIIGVGTFDRFSLANVANIYFQGSSKWSTIINGLDLSNVDPGYFSDIHFNSTLVSPNPSQDLVELPSLSLDGRSTIEIDNCEIVGSLTDNVQTPVILVGNQLPNPAQVVNNTSLVMTGTSVKRTTRPPTFQTELGGPGDPSPLVSVIGTDAVNLDFNSARLSSDSSKAVNYLINNSNAQSQIKTINESADFDTETQEAILLRALGPFAGIYMNLGGALVAKALSAQVQVSQNDSVVPNSARFGSNTFSLIDFTAAKMIPSLSSTPGNTIQTFNDFNASDAPENGAGPSVANIRTVIANTTVEQSDSTIVINGLGITVNLPVLPITSTGRIITVSTSVGSTGSVDSTTPNITFHNSSVSSVVLGTVTYSVTLQWDGTNWNTL